MTFWKTKLFFFFFLPGRLSLEFKAFLYFTVTPSNGSIFLPLLHSGPLQSHSPSVRHHPSSPKRMPSPCTDDPTSSAGSTSMFCSCPSPLRGLYIRPSILTHSSKNLGLCCCSDVIYEHLQEKYHNVSSFGAEISVCFDNGWQKGLANHRSSINRS